MLPCSEEHGDACLVVHFPSSVDFRHFLFSRKPTCPCEHSFAARGVLVPSVWRKVHQKDSVDSARAFRLPVFFTRPQASARGFSCRARDSVRSLARRDLGMSVCEKGVPEEQSVPCASSFCLCSIVLGLPRPAPTLRLPCRFRLFSSWTCLFFCLYAISAVHFCGEVLSSPLGVLVFHYHTLS